MTLKAIRDSGSKPLLFWDMCERTSPDCFTLLTMSLISSWKVLIQSVLYFL